MQPRGLLINRRSYSLKKSQLTLYQGMLKKRDDNYDEFNDEVRATNHVTATMSTEEFFLKTQYLKLSLHISREMWEH